MSTSNIGSRSFIPNQSPLPQAARPRPEVPATPAAEASEQERSALENVTNFAKAGKSAAVLIDRATPNSVRTTVMSNVANAVVGGLDGGIDSLADVKDGAAAASQLGTASGRMARVASAAGGTATVVGAALNARSVYESGSDILAGEGDLEDAKNVVVGSKGLAAAAGSAARAVVTHASDDAAIGVTRTIARAAVSASDNVAVAAGSRLATSALARRGLQAAGTAGALVVVAYQANQTAKAWEAASAEGATRADTTRAVGESIDLAGSAISALPIPGASLAGLGVSGVGIVVKATADVDMGALADDAIEVAGQAAEYVGDKAEQAVEAVSEAVSEAADVAVDYVSERASRAASVVSEGASRAVDVVSNRASQAASAVSDRANQAASAVSDRASQAAAATTNFFRSLW